MLVTYWVRLAEYHRWAVVLLVIAAGLAIAYLPLTLVGVSIVGAIVFLAILIRPHLGLYLLIFSIPFGPNVVFTVSATTLAAKILLR